MKKVVDCSALESDELADFFGASRENRAVLTDLCRIDAFGTGENVRATLRIIILHAKQAQLLKPTAAIWGLRPRAKGILSRLVDEDQTALFPKYCYYLNAGEEGIMKNALKKQAEGRALLDSLLPRATMMRSEMESTINSYPRGDLAALRAGKRLTNSFCRRIEHDVALQSAESFRDTFGNRRLPAAEDIKYSLAFRFAVCYFALAANRAAAGGLQGLSVEKFRNDVNDCFYSAYASYFDGLITRDTRQADVYNLSVKLLRAVFGVKLITAREVRLSEL